MFTTQKMRAHIPYDARRVVDVFASGLVPLKTLFSFEDDIFFAMKHCTVCYKHQEAPCAVCRKEMEAVGRAEEKLVYAFMTPAEYDESVAVLRKHHDRKRKR